MIANAQTCGFRAARQWIHDLLPAIRHQSGDTDTLGPIQQYVDLKDTLDLVRSQEAGRRLELNKAK